MKVPFLSISNTVTLKYSHERKRRGPKYTSRDRLKYILNAKIKRGFTTREQVCVRNYFRVEHRCSGIRPIARTGVINYDPFIRSKLPRYRLFRNDKRARDWDVASRESGSTDTLKSTVTGTMQRNKLHIALSAFACDQSRDARERVPQIDLARTQSLFAYR